MKKQLTEQQLQRLSRQCLDDLLENLDKSSVIRLQNSRHLALHSQSKNQHSAPWLTIFATIVLCIGLFWQIDRKFNNGKDDFLAIEDIIQVEENQDLVNDLDFYQWLESQANHDKQA